MFAPHSLALAAAIACAFSAPAALAAETTPAKPSTPAASPAAQVVVTGNPLGSDPVQASTALTGDALTLRRAGTLGETLDGLPGVASTGFGPNANRPVIRGLDGDRVRLMDNGGASIDASNLSFDHAVPVDPLVLERIEVLRGPAALLYGGNATGGAVNSMDNRIPVSALDGLGGRAEVRLGGASAERATSALVEGGGNGLNWHVDGFRRQTSDQRVPLFTPIEDGAAGDPARRVRNSASDSHGGAVGASWADAQGYVGASVDSFRQDYGVTVEPDVGIQMKRDRFSLAGERRQLSGPFTQVSVRYDHSKYQHQEVEGTGEVGTTFRSTGDALRVEARHVPLAPGLQGVIGLQAESMDFSALGEEAFVPATRTRSLAVFGLEEWRQGDLTLSFGLRAERVTVRSDGDAADAAEPRFGAADSRRFTPMSGSASARWALSPRWALTAAVGSTQRAPAYYELFANGQHVATAAYERGDTTLGLERSTHAEVGAQFAAGPDDSFRVNFWHMQFANYLALSASGAEIDGSPEYVFKGVPARLHGLEVEARHRLLSGAWQLDGTAGIDLTRGTERDTGEALPRIAPMRVQLGLALRHSGWQFDLGFKHLARQGRVPSTDVATASAHLFNLGVSTQTRWAQADALWFLKLDNLGNELAYNASAIRTVRDLSPMPGRAATAGVRVRF
ncbi:MAG: membrane receptor protein [Burkholderiales bacterium PBB6]|nr:MAG: membrane receptor protein [Burkholderiales bacterium PBB6]